MGKTAQKEAAMKNWPKRKFKARAFIESVSDKNAPMKKARLEDSVRGKKMVFKKAGGRAGYDIGKRVRKEDTSGMPQYPQEKKFEEGKFPRKVKISGSKRMGRNTFKTFTKEVPEGSRAHKQYLKKKSSEDRTSYKYGKKAAPDPKRSRSLEDKLTSARIEARIESAKDKINPLKGDRVAGRGEKKVSFKPGEGATLSDRGTTGKPWRQSKDQIDKFLKRKAEKHYKKTGQLFTNYSGKMKSMKPKRGGARQAAFGSGGAVLKGKKVGCQIK
jgi:hypothetical protein